MTQTFTNAQPSEPFTAERLLDLIADLPPAPVDPLNGATVLWVHADDTEAYQGARKLADAANGNPLKELRVHVTRSPNAFYGRIYGFKGGEFTPVVEIKLEKE